MIGHIPTWLGRNVHWSPKGPLSFISWDDFSTDNNGNVTGNAQCINAAGGPASEGAQQLLNYGCYITGSTTMTPPLFGTQGNMGRNIFRGPGFANWDFSLSKVWRLNERVKVQFRGEVFNILNHANFAGLSTDLSAPDSVGTVVYTPDIGAANPVIGSGGWRHIQLGAKLTW